MLTIGIVGGAGSGKSTIARALKEKLTSKQKTVEILSLDNNYFTDGVSGKYIIGKTNGKRFLDMNHPDSIDQMTVQKEVSLVSADVLIIEGLFLLAIPSISNQLDVSIYLDVPADIRLGRKIIRKYKEKQTSPEIVFRNYLETVRDRHFEFIEPCKENSTFVIDGTQQPFEQVSQLLHMLDIV